MSWQKRYQRIEVGKTSDGRPIYKNTHYVICDGDSRLLKPRVPGGFVVLINRIFNDGDKVSFNEDNIPPNNYTWKRVYDRYIVREATLDDIKEYKRIYHGI